MRFTVSKSALEYYLGMLGATTRTEAVDITELQSDDRRRLRNCAGKGAVTLAIARRPVSESPRHQIGQEAPGDRVFEDSNQQQ